MLCRPPGPAHHGSWREASQGCQATKWPFLLRLLSPGRGKASCFFHGACQRPERLIAERAQGKAPQSGAVLGRSCGGSPGQLPREQISPMPQQPFHPYLFVMNNYSSPFPSPPAWAQSSPLPERQQHVKVGCRISIKLYALRPPVIMHFR